MARQGIARPGVVHALTLLSAAIVASMFLDAAADASNLGLTDTVTNAGNTPTATGAGTTTLVTPTVSFALGDSFGPGAAISTSSNFTATNLGTPGPWNFYDDYVFTVTAGSSVQGAVVSFTTGNGTTDVSGISDLQARIFSTTPAYTPSVAQGNLGNPPTNGTVVDDSWLTMNSGNFYTVNLDSTTLAPGTYDLQVRGEVGTTGEVNPSGSYGGSVTFTAVPLPAALPLMLTGLGLFGGLGALRRRRPVLA